MREYVYQLLDYQTRPVLVKKRPRLQRLFVEMTDHPLHAIDESVRPTVPSLPPFLYRNISTLPPLNIQWIHFTPKVA